MRSISLDGFKSLEKKFCHENLLLKNADCVLRSLKEISRKKLETLINAQTKFSQAVKKLLKIGIGVQVVALLATFILFGIVLKKLGIIQSIKSVFNLLKWKQYLITMAILSFKEYEDDLISRLEELGKVAQ